VSEQTDIEETLAKIAAEVGGELQVEDRQRRTVAPMPTRRADGSFVNLACPRCGGEQFAHSLGDELCRCAGCGAVLDVDELEDPDPDPSFPSPNFPSRSAGPARDSAAAPSPADLPTD